MTLPTATHESKTKLKLRRDKLRQTWARPWRQLSNSAHPNAVVTSDSLVEQVAQLEEFASGKIEGREFFRSQWITL